jgi:hypothetical protein
LARTDCLSAFSWAAWTTLDALAGDALYAAAQLAVDAAYRISSPPLPRPSKRCRALQELTSLMNLTAEQHAAIASRQDRIS